MNRAASSDVTPNAGIDRARAIIFALIALIALAGVTETTYLTAFHLSGANVVCVASSNCSQVLQSAYASIKGVPLAAVGCLAYFIVFSAAILALFGYRKAPAFLAAMIGVMFLATLGLLYLQAFVLHAFCDYCLLSAAFVFLLAGLLVATPARR